MTWYQSLFVALTAGAFASIVTMWLSLKRFYSERWWQRRFDGCAMVIEAIHDLCRYTEIERNELYNDAKYDAEWKKDAGDRCSAASKLLRRYADLGQLALPEEVARIVTAHYAEADAHRHNGWPEDYDTYLEWKTNREGKLLSEVVPAAMRGLGLRRPWYMRILHRAKRREENSTR